MGSYNQAGGKEYKRRTLGKSWGHVDVDADGGGDHVEDVPWGLFVPAEPLYQRPPTLSLAPTPKPTTSSRESTTIKPSTTSHFQLLYKFQLDFRPGKHFLQTGH